MRLRRLGLAVAFAACAGAVCPGFAQETEGDPGTVSPVDWHREGLRAVFGARDLEVARTTSLADDNSDGGFLDSVFRSMPADQKDTLGDDLASLYEAAQGDDRSLLLMLLARFQSAAGERLVERVLQDDAAHTERNAAYFAALRMKLAAVSARALKDLGSASGDRMLALSILASLDSKVPLKDLETFRTNYEKDSRAQTFTAWDEDDLATFCVVLGNAEDPKVESWLSMLLAHDSEDVQECAVSEYTKVAPGRAKEYARNHASDKGLSARRAALGIMIALRTPADLESVLLGMRRDPDIGIRLGAAREAMRVGIAGRPDSWLINLEGENAGELVSQTRVLRATLRDASVIEELMMLLEEPFDAVRSTERRQASRLLNDLPESFLGPALESIIEQTGDSPEYFRTSLVKRNRREAAISIAASHRWALALPVLRARARGDSGVSQEVRIEAARRLARYHRPEDDEIFRVLLRELGKDIPGLGEGGLLLSAFDERQIRILANEIYPFLGSTFDDVRLEAAKALARVRAVEHSKVLMPILRKSWTDENFDGELLNLMSGLGRSESVPVIVNLLSKQHGMEVTELGVTSLAAIGPLSPAETIPWAEAGLRAESELPRMKWLILFATGGSPEGVAMANCIGTDAESRCNVDSMSTSEAEMLLTLVKALWSASAGQSRVRDMIAERASELARLKRFGSRGLNDLKYLQGEFASLGGRFTDEAEDIQRVLNSGQVDSYVRKGLSAVGLHAVFWLTLIFFYPRSTRVQAIFFWTPGVRKFLGLGYVGALLVWFPFLRNRMLAPFQAGLVGDAQLAALEHEKYIALSRGVELVAGRVVTQEKLLADLVPDIRGQVVLVGESGLGKTLFLRRLCAKTRRPVAFLPAQRCGAGPLAAIKQQLLGHAKEDEQFLAAMIYCGGLDIVIDGLNEVSADTRAEIVKFQESNTRANIIVSTQPMEWRLPKSAREVHLLPLSESDIEKFLIESFNETGKAVEADEAYAIRCRSFVQQARNEPQEYRRTELFRMMSNPMDLSVVASMLANGVTPNLLSLRQQQYQLMAADFRSKHAGRDFPLAAFSEACFKMRKEDAYNLKYDDFPDEIECLVRHKFVVLMPANQQDPQSKTTYRFRHDKIMEFFILQAFLGAANRRPAEHLEDTRFRGVYLLLAITLPVDAANKLRDMLVLQAANTKDHTLSDSFVTLLHNRSRNELEPESG